MISKNKTKFIISLQKKKVRDEERLFIIEGDKLVTEFLTAKIPVKTLIARPGFLNSLPDDLTRFVNEIIDVSIEDLKHISTLKTPHNALAVIPLPDKNPDINNVLKGLCVALDFVQDVYNPKVIQASMGAILHVDVYYYDLKELVISANEKNIPVFGTMLEGKSIYYHNLDNKGIILLGNESKGISDELIPFITDKIMIPKFSNAKQGIDSLNVGMAASVVFSEFLRKSGRLPE
jgi:TrmH family RNA methyltransferase